MPVNPVTKQDLMLVKEVFERKALDQDSSGALWLPAVSTVQNTRQIHQNIQKEAARYPAATYKNKEAKKDRSFLKQIQAECLPCTARIKALGDLDMVDDLFATLMAYNGNALKNMLNLFKSVSRPNRIQEDLCSVYTAFRSQCIPDIARIISALNLLMGKLRSFNLKSLKDQLLGLVGALIVRTIAFGALNYDMYVSMVTDVIKCIVSDINTQLAKVEPILSREGLEDIANLLPLDTQGGELSREEAARKKAASWFPNKGDFNVAEDISKKIGKGVEAIEGGRPVKDSEGNVTHTKGLNTFVNYNKAVDTGRLIADMMEEAVSVVDNKLQDATQELLKFLKLSDGNLKAQTQIIDQVQLIRSVLEVLKTIKDTKGDFDPCSSEAGRRFFSKIQFPGQDIRIENRRGDPEDPEDVSINILPPEIRVDNPIVEEILNENGIETGDATSNAVGDDQLGTGVVKSGRIVASVPVSINVSRCLDGKQ